MSTQNEVSTRAALGIPPHEPTPPELFRRIHRVEELAERQGRGWTLSRQIIAVVVEQWERDVGSDCSLIDCRRSLFKPGSEP